MTTRKWVAVLAGCLIFVADAAAGEITPAGRRLVRALDGLGVERLWLPGKYVRWESGEPLNKPVTDGKPHTHCSAFAASAAKRLGVYLLRPKGKDDPPGVKGHRETLLANAQFDWLHAEEGRKFGWRAVSSPAEAQRLANRGRLVVATYKESDPGRPGHIAIVRPDDTRTAAEVADDGPRIIQAGGKNAASTTVRAGFRSHKGAWGKSKGVRFFSHALELP